MLLPQFIDLIKAYVHGVSFDVFSALVIPVAVFSILFYIFGIAGILQKNTTRKYGTLKNFPKVTIQIPTFNELVAIRCAEQCLKMNYPKNKYEIIIGDDSSDKNVSAMIDNFAAKYKGRIKVARRGTNAGFKAGNLNNMINYSKGELIVVFDSDFIPPKNFLKRIVAPFEDEKVACVQSKWEYLNMDQNWTTKFAGTVLMVYHNILARLNNSFGVSLLFGSGEAVRKSTLVKLGGWQNGSVTEDVEFSVRALTKGYKTVYLHDLNVEGEVPYTVRSLRTQQRRWAYGNAKAFLEHKKSILFGKFSVMQKALMTFTMLGYVSSFFLVAFMFFGALSFITGSPSQINLLRLGTDVGVNLVLSSGFTFAGIIVLWKEGKLRHTLVVFFSALTVGILVSLSVCHGILKALQGKPMHWVVIGKTGNVDFLPSAYGIKIPTLKSS